VYDERPWLALYDEGRSAELELEHRTGLELFEHAVRTAPERPAVHYFDATLTWAEVDRASDALAVGLGELGVGPGDRVAVQLQNMPQFLLALAAIWKAGAALVPVNPMYKAREVGVVLEDSGARVLIVLESLVEAGVAVEHVVTTSELDFLDAVPALLASAERRRGPLDLLELIERNAGRRPGAPPAGPDDVALLTYTSGTTGPPKGAMNTHANVAFNAQAYRDWIGLTPDDVVLAIAPLFHVTGLIGHLAVAMLVPMPLVLGYRFDAATTFALAERHGTTYTVAAITAYQALLREETGTLPALSKAYSGGAPIAPAVVERFEKRFGAYIHNIYGLTETTSPSHGVPFSRRAPVDPGSGALSIGVPIFGTVCRVLDDDGAELPPGAVGELVTSGPQVIPGYWGKPEETEAALPGGALHTGDVGFMDGDGWFYVVDRKKDQINAAGYKVWPREVEDALYEHPDVREAAVIGVPDEYRGETVKAFVVLAPGAAAGPDELIAFARERLAAYKRPHAVEILEELPKTMTGKVLRRALRDT
jgi:long-chain acyl-CoA synthetase